MEHQIIGVVILGSGKLKASSQRRWTPGDVYPDSKAIYHEMRTQSKKFVEPLNVIVPGSGNLQLNLSVFRERDILVLIVPSEFGTERIHRQPFPESIQVKVACLDGRIGASEILTSVQAVCEGPSYFWKVGLTF
jgi:hypothetical protein